jgi:hypothetical protein
MAFSVQGRPRKARQVKSKVKSMLIILFDIKGIAHKDSSSWRAIQSISCNAVKFYGDCLEMCEDFYLNYSDKRTGCCIMTTRRFTLSFSPGNFLLKTT